MPQSLPVIDVDEVQHPTLGKLKFPKSMPVSERNQIIDEMLAKQKDLPKIEAMPPLFSVRGMKSRGQELKSKAEELGAKTRDIAYRSLPAIGGTVGGVLGATGGPITAVGGAVLGGGAGKAAQQLVDYTQGKGPKTSGEAAKQIGTEGLEQGAMEAGGAGIAKVAKMIIPTSRAARIAYGAKAGEIGESFEKLIPEFDKTIAQSGTKGVKSIGDLERIVQETDARLEQEYGMALGPVAQQKVFPQDVADAIRTLKKEGNTAAEQSYNKIIEKRAREYEKPWKISGLESNRKDLNKGMKAYFKAAPSDKATKVALDAEEAADREANLALNDMLYSRADTLAGKPKGYFADLKRKQSGLITLQNAVEKNKQALTKASLEESGAPLGERIHQKAYLHPNLKPGGAIGVTPGVLSTPLEKANTAIQKGFPSTSRKVVNAARTAMGKPLSNAQIDALPIRYLFLPEPEKKQLPPIQP